MTHVPSNPLLIPIPTAVVMGDWKLLGIAFIIVGLALRWRTGPVVVAAAGLTGLLAGLPAIGSPAVPGIIDTLGKAFLDNRAVSLFLLTLPAIGLCEKNGLHAQAGRLAAKLKTAGVGMFLWWYQVFRIAVGLLGLRLNGHAVFGRPLILPMALGLNPAPEQSETVRASVGASENYGNFFGQNLFPASVGCLLVQKVLADSGFPVNPVWLSIHAVPIVLISAILSRVQFSKISVPPAVTGTAPETSSEENP